MFLVGGRIIEFEVGLNPVTIGGQRRLLLFGGSWAHVVHGDTEKTKAYRQCAWPLSYSLIIAFLYEWILMGPAHSS